jgi:hypothetical protein
MYTTSWSVGTLGRSGVGRLYPPGISGLTEQQSEKQEASSSVDVSVRM